jgi:hypothetical protein
VRSDLTRAAIARAEALGPAIDPAEVIVVGDTPRDIEADTARDDRGRRRDGEYSVDQPAVRAPSTCCARSPTGPVGD